MDASDILKKVRKIEIKTRSISKQIFSGEYQSAFKGRGMSFSEVRDYHYGDDIRNIDWNVTARTGDAHIKVFEEERELTVMLLIDISQSSIFGTQAQFKNEIITELAAVIAFSASLNNDKVGAILFSDKVEKYIPPKKGRSHILRIIREILYHEAESKGTDLSIALEYLNNVQKKKAITFILSDFMVQDYETALSIATRRHDIVGMHIYDERERTMPNVGMLRSVDPETDEMVFLDTSSRKVREKDHLSIATGEDYVKKLLKFFKRRSS